MANLLASPSLKHRRFITRARELPLVGSARLAEYSDGKELGDEDAALVPSTCTGRLLFAEEARQLSDKLCAARADEAKRSVERES